MTNDIDYRTLMDVAVEVAIDGGKKTLEYFRRPIQIERKADESPVTIADKETEQRIRTLIEDRYPTHHIVGEEFGGSLGSDEWEWVIDPIDGTKSFIRGVPLYTTLVAVVHKGNPVVGVIYAPATGELAAAAEGHGAFDGDGNRLSTSGCTSIDTAWFLTTDPHDLSMRHPRFAKQIIERCAAVRTWADAYGYLLLARGDADLMIDPIMSPWDIAPLSVVLREAGGTFTSLYGEKRDLGSSALAAGTEELHSEALNLVREFAPR